MLFFHSSSYFFSILDLLAILKLHKSKADDDADADARQESNGAKMHQLNDELLLR